MGVLISYLEIFLIVPCFLFLYYTYTRSWNVPTRHKNCLPRKWPIIGMLPTLLQNTTSHRIHKRITEVLKDSGGTFKFAGPWFANLDMLFTSDPANIQHILNTNSSNFPKGPESNQIFDILGDAFFNVDFELWESQRRAMSVVSHRGFLKLVPKTMRDKVEKGLIPVLDHFSELGRPVDLQQLFKHFTLDSASIFVFGQDPAKLSIELPHNAREKAFADVEEAILYRHAFPECFWKLQRWINVGKEKKLAKAWKTIDLFMAQCISAKREEYLRSKTTQMMEYPGPGEYSFDIFTAYMKTFDDGKSYEYGASNFDKLLRDGLLNSLLAAGETISAALTWFFWLLATNPLEEKKIREEITMNLHPKQEDHHGKLLLSSNFFDIDELKKLVYLHAAICETLRLFPPVPLQHRTSVETDILPSGQSVGAKTRILMSFFAMGRIESIWGKDCLEFKPKRWITEQGGIKYEPPFKFTAFNAGPRICLGKDLALIQMKIIAAAIICNYDIQLVEGHPVSPRMSIILHMQDGLKVMVTKRSAN